MATKETNPEMVQGAPEKKGNAPAAPQKDNVKILNSMIDEAQKSQYPRTYIGTIESIGKTADGKRMIAISVNSGTVYMDEQEAPEWAVSGKAEDLIGREIAFKPLSIRNGNIYVSNRFCSEMYKIAMKNDETFTGTYISVYPNEDIEKAYVLVHSHGDTLTMPLKEFSVFGIPRYLPLILKRRCEFKVIGVDESGKVYVSAAKIEAARRDAVIKELEEHPEGIQAVITKVKGFGAYLSYKDVPLVLRNKDYSLDYTPVQDIKKAGDAMIVKLTEISEKRRIFVEPVEKYKSPSEIRSEMFARDQIVMGTVNGTTMSAVYVRITPGVDVMCPNPEGMRDLIKGDKVRVRLTSVRTDESKGLPLTRIKGRVIGFVGNSLVKGSEEPAKPEEGEEDVRKEG